MLVDRRRIKNASVRKADALDCQWLRQLHAYGLFSGASRPEADIQRLHNYLRQRAALVEYASGHIQHMQKALTQMIVKLLNVISNITGKTRMAIIEAIAGSERDPRRLAKLCDGRIRATEETIASSLQRHLLKERIFDLAGALHPSRRTDHPHCRTRGEQNRRYLDSTSPARLPVRGGCVPGMPAKVSAHCGTGQEGMSGSDPCQEGLLQAARASQQSPDYNQYRRRRVVSEHRLALLEQFGIRQGRNFGRVKMEFQLYLVATVANLTLPANQIGLTADFGNDDQGTPSAIAADFFADHGVHRHPLPSWLLACLNSPTLALSLFPTRAFRTASSGRPHALV